MEEETTYTEDDIKYFYWDRTYSSFRSYLEYKADSYFKVENVKDAYNYYRWIADFYPSNWRGWWGIIRCFSHDFKSFDFIDSEVYMEKLKKTAVDPQGQAEAARLSSIFDSQWPEIQENRKKRAEEDAKRSADNFYNMKFRRKDGVLTEYTGSDSVVIIPSDVTVIDAAAFRGNGRIERVVIHSGVTTIGKDAFAKCTGLKDIRFPASVTEIGKGALSGCFSLEDIVINGNIETMEDNLFNDCRKLKNVTIKNGVKHIKKAFVGCVELSSIVIPKTVEDLADFCFSGCEKLTAVAMLNENIKLGRRTFLNCPLENKEELSQKFGSEIFY